MDHYRDMLNIYRSSRVVSFLIKLIVSFIILLTLLICWKTFLFDKLLPVLSMREFFKKTNDLFNVEFFISLGLCVFLDWKYLIPPLSQAGVI